VGVGVLSHDAIGRAEAPLSQVDFEIDFGTDNPIIINYHGYKNDLVPILSQYTDLKRVTIHGFSEEGCTTTPRDMLLRNGASRWDLAISAAKFLKRDDLVEKYMAEIAEARRFAVENGVDK